MCLSSILQKLYGFGFDALDFFDEVLLAAETKLLFEENWSC